MDWSSLIRASNGLEVIAVALIIGVLGPFSIAWYTNRQRQQERAEDKRDREQVATRAEVAATKVSQVATALSESNTTTTDRLKEISDTGKATHQLVNNDRSIDKTYIAKLTKVIARLLPDDADAQAAAEEAQADADRLPKPIDKT